MKQIYISKDLNSLFVLPNDLQQTHGFDLLNKSKLTKLDYKNLIKVSHDCKLLLALLKDDAFKVELAELLFDNVNEQSIYIGVSNRTWHRIKQNL